MIPLILTHWYLLRCYVLEIFVTVNSGLLTIENVAEVDSRVKIVEQLGSLMQHAVGNEKCDFLFATKLNVN